MSPETVWKPTGFWRGPTPSEEELQELQNGGIAAINNQDLVNTPPPNSGNSPLRAVLSRVVRGILDL